MKLSVALAIFNEETVIARCLESVYNLADEIVIVDGGSTDKTLDIIKKLDTPLRQGSGGASKIRVFHEGNAPMFHINKQKAIEKCKGEWILQLDADEVVTPELGKEIRAVVSEQTNLTNSTNSRLIQPVAYWIPRLNYFLGRPLRKGGQYPDYTTRLYKNGVAHFPCKTVHEQVEIQRARGGDGEDWESGRQSGDEEKMGRLANPLLHYPYATFSSYIDKWVRYATLEAAESYKKGVRPSLYNAIMYFKVYPTIWFLKTYFRHKGFMDGFPGFVFSLFSSLRYWVEYIALYERVRGEEEIG